MQELDLSLRCEPHTAGSALRRWTAALTRSGIEGAGGDVRRLMAAVLGAPASAILSEPGRPLTDAQLATLSSYVARRANHEPVSRILGCRDFYGRSFTISSATLDPRPESETLIAAALEIAREEGWERPRILDVGTGSGCLLLTLLCELGNARGTGTDISVAALAIARANARRLGVTERASWLRTDALETVSGPFHILIANPPYVRTGEIAHLEPEVCNFDPISALDGGADGLALYRRLVPRIPSAVPNGWVVLEVGCDQADEVMSIISRGGGNVDATAIRVRLDVSGKRRCVAVKTRAGAYA